MAAERKIHILQTTKNKHVVIPYAYAVEVEESCPMPLQEKC